MLPTYKLPIGPQHPAIKEAFHFTFELDGEVIVDVKPRLGNVHRGIEKGMEFRSWNQGTFLVERICGICNTPHTTCYALTVEEIYGVEAPPRAQYIRTIINELNRIHSHMLWIGILGMELGFWSYFMYVWRDRERVMDIIEMITGNRVNTATIIIGGVAYDIPPHMEGPIRRAMDYLEERMKFYKQVLLNEPTIRARTENVGVLSKSKARELCAVGPVARASDLKTDVRFDEPYCSYGEVSFNLVTYPYCDVYARALVRADETLESIEIVRQCLDKMPSGPIKLRLPRAPPPGEAVNRVEAPRGELLHYCKSDGKEKPYRFKARTPTLANIPALCEMLKGYYIADIPAIVASIDPCYCCTERMTFVDVNTGKRWVWTYNELRNYSLKWYKANGGGRK
ncbi:MAG: NADH dehydrogenase subunit [Candidatus Methanomethylicota archaeon]|uniref:NADH dehydrogenase subunit n=1 Tax=Thermoproteota archaeon TaxID=2056631 RepID=A0A497EYY0_9CREN|nr:MAG: NADH dehydrogenase subunit [Candidatus Verstraetearchaeota archaeon]